MAEGGDVRRSGRSRARSLKAELNRATEDKLSQAMAELPAEEEDESMEESHEEDSGEASEGEEEECEAGDSGEECEGGDSGEECEGGDSGEECEAGDSGEECEGGDSGEECEAGAEVRRTTRRSSAIVERQTKEDKPAESRKRKRSSEKSSKTPSKTKKKTSEDAVLMETNTGGSHDPEPMSPDFAEASCDPEESSHGLPESGCWEHYKQLCDTLPGREEIIELLLTLFGEVSCIT